MKKTVLLLVLLLCLPVWGLATVTKIVDPDEGGGFHYSSLDAWEDALGGTTTGHLPNDDQIAVAQCRASGGTNDTAAVNILGWTTDATRYIRIELHSNETNTGIWNDNNYILHNNDASAAAIVIFEDYVRFHDIQILVTETGANARDGIYCVGSVGTADIRVDSCIIKGACSGTGTGRGILFNDGSATFTIYNTIVYGFVSGADADFDGIRIGANTAAYVYNCTIYGNYAGITSTSASHPTVKNCAVGNNTDDFQGITGGGFTMDYIVSDDDHSGDCANYFARPTAGENDWTSDFTTPGSNFSLLATAANLIDDGVADLFDEDDDIIGTARPQGVAWDIGAFEFEAGAPAGFNMWFIRDNKKGGKL